MSDWTLHDLYSHMEMPIVPLVDQMMETGMQIDRPYMAKLVEKYREKKQEHTTAAETVIRNAGHDCPPGSLNLGSNDQIAHALYDQMKMRVFGYTKGGKKGVRKPATDEGTLKKLADSLVMVPNSAAGQLMTHVLEYRRYDKLDGTYADKCVELADESSKIYTTIKQTRTASGRLSSAEPFNFQNFPSDGDEAVEFRDGFVCPPGYCFLSLDFNAIEMRYIAHQSLDPAMMVMFILDQDIHSHTAARMWKIPVEQVHPKKQRYPAKRVGFGVAYGITDIGLLPHVPEENRNRQFTQWLIDTYYELYPKIRSNQEAVWAFARRYRWVADQWGRVRYIPEVASAIDRIVQSGLREAFNHTIQSGAQGCIKIPMGDTKPLIERYHLDCKPIIQIHDSMDFYIRKDQVREAAEIFGEEYANAVGLKVPVKVEVTTGERWGHAEKIGSYTSR